LIQINDSSIARRKMNMDDARSGSDVNS